MYSGMLGWNASVDDLSADTREEYVIETDEGQLIDLTPSTFTSIQYDPAADQVRATITTSEGDKAAEILVSGGRLTFLRPPGQEFRNTRVDSFRDLSCP